MVAMQNDNDEDDDHHHHNDHNDTTLAPRSHMTTRTTRVLLLYAKVRVSARTLAGYGVPSREALLRTRVSPPSAPKEAATMVSATPNSITVGWVPPKYENGKCVVM